MSTDLTLPVEDSPAPPPAENLEPDFLTVALQNHCPGSVVTECRSEPLVDRAGMAGALFRVRLTGSGGALPTSLIAKFSPSDPTLLTQLNQMGFFAREVAFYRRLAAATPVRTPICYFAHIDQMSGAAVLLLEDLNPARNGDSVVGETIEQVSALLSELARMHARWWRDDALDHDEPWTRLPSMLAPSAVAYVFEEAWPSFLNKLSIPVDHAITDARAWITATLPTAATVLFESGPRTLIHNDVQPDNLFYGSGSGRYVIFVDWQMITYARCVVDVANAIRGMLPPEIRREAESGLLSLYHGALVRWGITNYPLQQCQADYDLATVLAPARLASAVGLHPGLHAHPGAAWDTLFPRLTAP